MLYYIIQAFQKVQEVILIQLELRDTTLGTWHQNLACHKADLAICSNFQNGATLANANLPETLEDHIQARMTHPLAL